MKYLASFRNPIALTGADWLYFSARAQSIYYDQTGQRIVENVNQWAEILRNATVSMLSRTFSLRVAGPSGIRPNCPNGQPAPELLESFRNPITFLERFESYRIPKTF